jgi:copper resistance protein C
VRVNPAGRRVHAAVSLGLLLWLGALPAGVAAHSELKTSDPADGEVVIGSPNEIVLTFTAALNQDKSSATLHDASGAQLAKGGVDAADDTVMRFVPPSLDPGRYEIRWTSASLDGDILRGTLHFEVELSPTAEPTETPTPAPSATPPPTPAPSASPSPSPSPSAAPGPAGASGGDVLVPIVAAVVVVGILGAMLLRGRSRGGGLA